MRRLDIGAGRHPHAPGFLTVDRYARANIRADMWRIPLPPGSVTEIWSSHALEHIPSDKVGPTLREWHRLLAPDGTATILVPNLDYAARYWLDHPGEPWALAILFGNQRHAGQFHRTGWSAATLHAALVAAGFTVDSVEVIWSHDQETLEARVRP